MIKKIIAVIVTILIRMTWSQSSNDCNDDHNDEEVPLIITITTIIGSYSNKKKNITISINDSSVKIK